MSKARSKASSSVSAVLPAGNTPALLTSTSTSPTRSSRRLTSSRFDRSAPMKEARPPGGLDRAHDVRRPLCSLRPVMMTSAPALASRSATARPIPEVLPVTTALLPCRDVYASPLFCPASGSRPFQLLRPRADAMRSPRPNHAAPAAMPRGIVARYRGRDRSRGDRTVGGQVPARARTAGGSGATRARIPWSLKVRFRDRYAAHADDPGWLSWIAEIKRLISSARQQPQPTNAAIPRRPGIKSAMTR